MALMRNPSLQAVLVLAVFLFWTLGGCAQEEQGTVPPPETSSMTPTAPPPPIAKPLGENAHPALSGSEGQGSASQIMAKINQYRERLESDPKDLEALIALGNANFDIQRFKIASELYLRALEVDPQNVLVRTDLASCLRNIGEMDQALKELEKVLSYNPVHETALYNLGVMLFNDNKDPKGAVAAWEKLIEAHPEVAYVADLQKRIDEIQKGPSLKEEGG